MPSHMSTPAEFVHPNASFEHQSHLAWEQLHERDKPLPGWVFRNRQVKAINQYITLRTYRQVNFDAPLPDGFSWANLDHCGGWSRWWHTPDGSVAHDSTVLTARILAGEKIAGSAAILANGDEDRLRAVLAAVEDTPGYTATVSAAGNPNFQSVWIAPDKHLGEMVDLDPIRGFYDNNGLDPYTLAGAEDIYLPGQGTNYAFDRHHAYITGLILGYPPASTLSILLHG